LKLSFKVLALAFAGGVLGTALRYGLANLTQQNLITLFVVNLVGATALGWFNSDSRFFTDPMRAFWSVGFAGGFTTMSGLAVWVAINTLIAPWATMLAVAMMLLGVASYFAGFGAARRFAK
jgi:fluoride ion exporter CrcB/FEX